MFVVSSAQGVASLGIVSLKRLHNNTAWLVAEVAMDVVSVVPAVGVLVHQHLDPGCQAGIKANTSFATC